MTKGFNKLIDLNLDKGRNIINETEISSFMEELSENVSPNERGLKIQRWLKTVARKHWIRSLPASPAEKSSDEPAWAQKARENGSLLLRCTIDPGEAARLSHALDWMASEDGPSPRGDWQRMAYGDAIKASDAWSAILAKRAEKMAKIVRRSELAEEGESSLVSNLSGGWTVWKISGQKALVDEGNEMGNCVSSKLESIEDGSLILYSLRDPSGKIKAHISTNGKGRLIEAKGKANTPLPQVSIDAFFEFVKNRKVDISSQAALLELQAAGLVSIDDRWVKIKDIPKGTVLDGDLQIPADYTGAWPSDGIALTGSISFPFEWTGSWPSQIKAGHVEIRCKHNDPPPSVQTQTLDISKSGMTHLPPSLKIKHLEASFSNLRNFKISDAIETANLESVWLDSSIEGHVERITGKYNITGAGVQVNENGKALISKLSLRECWDMLESDEKSSLGSGTLNPFIFQNSHLMVGRGASPISFFVPQSEYLNDLGRPLTLANNIGLSRDIMAEFKHKIDHMHIPSARDVREYWNQKNITENVSDWFIGKTQKSNKSFSTKKKDVIIEQENQHWRSAKKIASEMFQTVMFFHYLGVKIDPRAVKIMLLMEMNKYDRLQRNPAILEKMDELTVWFNDLASLTPVKPTDMIPLMLSNDDKDKVLSIFPNGASAEEESIELSKLDFIYKINEALLSHSLTPFLDPDALSELLKGASLSDILGSEASKKWDALSIRSSENTQKWESACREIFSDLFSFCSNSSTTTIGSEKSFKDLDDVENWVRGLQGRKTEGSPANIREALQVLGDSIPLDFAFNKELAERYIEVLKVVQRGKVSEQEVVRVLTEGFKRNGGDIYDNHYTLSLSQYMMEANFQRDGVISAVVSVRMDVNKNARLESKLKIEPLIRQCVEPSKSFSSRK